jgi:hypothetical protein
VLWRLKINVTPAMQWATDQEAPVGLMVILYWKILYKKYMGKNMGF